MFIINFKTYKEASGENAKRLVQVIDEVVMENKNVSFVSCPQAVDIRNCVSIANHKIWMQHVDSGERGRQTGFVPVEIAKEIGAVGTLLNHSEHKLSVGVLGETMARCKEIGLKTLVFADGLEEAVMVSKFQPDFIGYEPPELVGSKETSVSKSKPEVIEKVVKEVQSAPIIVGAGVKEKQDVEVALKLGAKGIAIASAVVLADDQKKIINELTSSF